MSIQAYTVIRDIRALTENSPVSGSSLKKAEFSMDILTFIAIPNEFWKGKGFV